MLRITLAQMRRSAGRLAAAGIAIVIGAAFITITLLAGNVMTYSARATIAASYGEADLVVQASGASLTEADIATVRELPGVAAADSNAVTFQTFDVGGRYSFGQILATTSDPRLSPLVLAEGALPVSPDEIALPVSLADRLNVSVGDTVTMELGTLTASGDWETVPTELRLVGTVEDPRGAFSATGGSALATPEAIAAWSHAGGASPELQFGAVLVALEPAANQNQERDAIAQEVQAAHPEASISVLTPSQIADNAAANATGGTNVTMIGMLFAAIALLVAGLVIANTFQVLLAQRTRTLALLRCVGADKAQLHRSVLLEALILGFAASVAGLVLGAVLAAIALLVAPNLTTAPLPAVPTFTAATVLVPLLVGTGVTLLAALAPARLATRVAPLAALRPLDVPTTGRAAGRVRLVLSTLMALGGFALLFRGVTVAAASASQGLLLGVLGGAVSFVGVALSAVFWLPAVAGALGALVARFGPTPKLAAANALRNPRRTAATATALLIGVTLVSMMSTAAATAQRTLDAELDTRFPVDVQVDTDLGGALGTPLDPAIRAAVLGHDGVAAVADVTTVTTTTPAGQTVLARGIDPASAEVVLHDPTLIAGLAPETAVVPVNIAEPLDLTDGSELNLTGPTGSVTLRVVISEMHESGVFVLPQVAQTLSAGAQPTGLWIALARGADAFGTVQDLRDVIVDTGAVASTSGAVVERSEIENVISTLLTVLLGLLGAAVVIALIGVANTLSLSVIERQRESATLRAIGLSRRSLRASLAIEGVLIAGVGTVVGIVLGLLYGWAGAATVFGSLENMRLSIPWTQIAAVAVIALGAAVLASILPGRTAANTSPVAALAAE